MTGFCVHLILQNVGILTWLIIHEPFYEGPGPCLQVFSWLVSYLFCWLVGWLVGWLAG